MLRHPCGRPESAWALCCWREAQPWAPRPIDPVNLPGGVETRGLAGPGLGRPGEGLSFLFGANNVLELKAAIFHFDISNDLQWVAGTTMDCKASCNLKDTTLAMQKHNKSHPHHIIFQHIPTIQHSSATALLYTQPPASQVQTLAPHPQRVGHLHRIGGRPEAPTGRVRGSNFWWWFRGKLLKDMFRINFWGGLSFVLFFVHDSWGLTCLPLKMLFFDVPFLNYRLAFWRHGMSMSCVNTGPAIANLRPIKSQLCLCWFWYQTCYILGSQVTWPVTAMTTAKIAGLYSLEVFVGSSAILLLPPAPTDVNIFWLLLGTYSFVSALSQNGGHASIAFYHFFMRKEREVTVFWKGQITIFLDYPHLVI